MNKYRIFIVFAIIFVEFLLMVLVVKLLTGDVKILY
jgi:hypothetical protein